MSAPPRLVDCALRFVNRQARAKGAPRCLPFSCTEEQLPLLLQAVQQRVHADTAARAAAAAAISPLCSSDQQLVRSMMTHLQQWPDMIQQLWMAMSARKLSKEQVSARPSTHSLMRALCVAVASRVWRVVCRLWAPLCINRSDSCTSRRLYMIMFAMWRCNIGRASAVRYVGYTDAMSDAEARRGAFAHVVAVVVALLFRQRIQTESRMSYPACEWAAPWTSLPFRKRCGI